MAKKRTATKKPNIVNENLLSDTIRVVPADSKPINNLNNDRLTDLLAILFIFGIAMFIRLYVRFVFDEFYTSRSTFNITIPETDPLGVGPYTGTDTGQAVNSEGYGDFYAYYIDYVNAFVNGWNPYSGHQNPEDRLNGYVYGPFYIYFIALGSILFDLNAFDSIVYSNIIFDSLSYVMVYILLKRVTGNVISFIAALIGSFSPVSLFYMAIKGLNAPMMNFFFLLFLYYYLEKKDTRSMMILAIATLTKQFPLFFALPAGFWMMRRYGILKGISFILLFIFFVLLFSLPWIIYSPVLYFLRLFAPGDGKTRYICPKNSEATNLVHGALAEACSGQNPGAEIPASELSMSVKMLFFLVNGHFIFFAYVILLGLLAFTSYDYMEKNPHLYFRFVAGYFFMLHATIARGIYKYYLAFLIPLMILALVPGVSDKSLNIKIGKAIHHGFSQWINPKNRSKPASFRYWFGFSVLISSIISVFYLIDISISLFATTLQYRILWRVILFPIVILTIIYPSNIKSSVLENDKLKIIVKNSILFLILIIPSSYFLHKLAKIYFEDNIDALSNHLIIAGIVTIIFSLVIFIGIIIFDEHNNHKLINGDIEQFIIDIIILAIAFIVINYFNIQVLTVFRYYTSSLVFAFGILFFRIIGNRSVE